MKSNAIAIVPRTAPAANARASATPATYSPPTATGAGGNMNARAVAASDSGYGSPGVTGAGTGARGAAAAVPISTDYSPPGGTGMNIGTGPWGGFAVDTGGDEPPILTPNGPMK